LLFLHRSTIRRWSMRDEPARLPRPRLRGAGARQEPITTVVAELKNEMDPRSVLDGDVATLLASLSDDDPAPATSSRRCSVIFLQQRWRNKRRRLDRTTSQGWVMPTGRRRRPRPSAICLGSTIFRTSCVSSCTRRATCPMLPGPSSRASIPSRSRGLHRQPPAAPQPGCRLYHSRDTCPVSGG